MYSATSLSLLNKEAILLPTAKHRMEKRTPMETEALRFTLMENFAALASPLPNSFATRTLYKQNH